MKNRQSFRHSSGTAGFAAPPLACLLIVSMVLSNRPAPSLGQASTHDREIYSSEAITQSLLSFGGIAEGPTKALHCQRAGRAFKRAGIVEAAQTEVLMAGSLLGILAIGISAGLAAMSSGIASVPPDQGIAQAGFWGLVATTMISLPSGPAMPRRTFFKNVGTVMGTALIATGPLSGDDGPTLKWFEDDFLPSAQSLFEKAGRGEVRWIDLKKWADQHVIPKWGKDHDIWITDKTTVMSERQMIEFWALLNEKILIPSGFYSFPRTPVGERAGRILKTEQQETLMGFRAPVHWVHPLRGTAPEPFTSSLGIFMPEDYAGPDWPASPEDFDPARRPEWGGSPQATHYLTEFRNWLYREHALAKRSTRAPRNQLREILLLEELAHFDLYNYLGHVTQVDPSVYTVDDWKNYLMTHVFRPEQRLFPEGFDSLEPAQKYAYLYALVEMEAAFEVLADRMGNDRREGDEPRLVSLLAFIKQLSLATPDSKPDSYHTEAGIVRNILTRLWLGADVLERIQKEAADNPGMNAAEQSRRRAELGQALMARKRDTYLIEKLEQDVTGLPQAVDANVNIRILAQKAQESIVLSSEERHQRMKIAERRILESGVPQADPLDQFVRITARGERPIAGIPRRLFIARPSVAGFAAVAVSLLSGNPLFHIFSEPESSMMAGGAAILPASARSRRSYSKRRVLEQLPGLRASDLAIGRAA